MSKQPPITVLRDAGFAFGLWPWAQGPLYALEREWPFQVRLTDDPQGPRRSFTIPPGYEFDGASVPAFFWGFPFGYTPFGLHIAAALEHDFLCDLGRGGSAWLRQTLGADYPAPVASRLTHAHFARRLTEDGLRPGRSWSMGTAVRLFGPRWQIAALALLLALAPSCAGTAFYGSDGRRIATFEGDMQDVRLHRAADGALTWTAAQVDHSTATQAQGQATVGKITALGAAARSAGLTPRLP